MQAGSLHPTPRRNRPIPDPYSPYSGHDCDAKQLIVSSTDLSSLLFLHHFLPFSFWPSPTATSAALAPLPRHQAANSSSSHACFIPNVSQLPSPHVKVSPILPLLPDSASVCLLRSCSLPTRRHVLFPQVPHDSCARQTRRLPNPLIQLTPSQSSFHGLCCIQTCASHPTNSLPFNITLLVLPTSTTTSSLIPPLFFTSLPLGLFPPGLVLVS